MGHTAGDFAGQSQGMKPPIDSRPTIESAHESLARFTGELHDRLATLEERLKPVLLYEKPPIPDGSRDPAIIVDESPMRWTIKVFQGTVQNAIHRIDTIIQRLDL